MLRLAGGFVQPRQVVVAVGQRRIISERDHVGLERGPRPPLDLPLTVFAGRSDRYAPPEAMVGWRELSTMPTPIHACNGAHFFVRDDPEFWRLFRELFERI